MRRWYRDWASRSSVIHKQGWEEVHQTYGCIKILVHGQGTTNSLFANDCNLFPFMFWNQGCISKNMCFSYYDKSKCLLWKRPMLSEKKTGLVEKKSIGTWKNEAQRLDLILSDELLLLNFVNVKPNQNQFQDWTMCFYATSEALPTLQVASSQFSWTCACSDTAGLTSRLYLTANAHRNPNPKLSKYVPAYSKPAESNYS